MTRPPRPYLVGAGVVSALLIGVGFLPLFGGPGYEHALASGLIVPSAAAIATAWSTARGQSPSPLAAVGRGIAAGLVYATLALATALIHAARVGICELWGAVLYFALSAGVGSMLGGAWGAFAGEVSLALAEKNRISRPRLLAVVLALAAPLGGVVVSIYRFWSSPMIFAFDPFVGYFSGTLYDTVIDAGSGLLTYRFGTLATLSALVLSASILERNRERRLGVALDLRSAGALARGALALALAATSVGMVLAGVSLGHFSTADSIAKDLGAERHGARCDVVYPSTTREQEAKLLLKDCEEEVAQVEARLGLEGPPRIRAFFFRDANDKKRLMGAAHTNIAKPWREEVYVQLGSYPHPVLAHELAHVIAGRAGRGPFKIAGDVGGLLPNPGLIEGIAVAAAPDDEDLTDEQWARAMMQIGILPSMRSVFSLGFLGDASSKSYTVAGSFVSWIGSKWGMGVVRAWYGGGNIEVLTGKDWRALEAAYREYLQTVPLPPEAESVARARFGRPGIFGRRCPHLVDATRQEADTCRDTQRFEDALRLYDVALAKDPLDHASRHSRAQTMRRHGDREKGRAELESLAARKDVPQTWRDRADEALADADFIDGQLEAAGVRYAALRARSVDEDAARTLEVKELATKDPAAREAIQALLIGDDIHGPDMFVGGVALGRYSERGHSGLASYLVGRNLVQRGHYDGGARALDEALTEPPPTARIARETLRQRAIAACALSDASALARVRAVIEGPNDPFKGASGGRREATLGMIARCAR